MTPPGGTVSSIADRARNGAAVDAQGGLFDKEFDDTNLEALLDKREEKKVKRGNAQKAFKEADDLVKARLGEFELADGEVARVGKYRIEKKAIAAKDVSFSTDPSSRLNIKLFD